jgi:hypothetical protein
MPTVSFFLRFAALAALAAPQAAAQVVHGRVLDAGSGAPVPATAVWLRESTMDDVGPVRTDSSGAFTLRAPRGGSFRLAAGRVGYREAESPPFVLEEGDSLEVVFRISARSVLLNPVEVVVSARRRPGWLEAFYRRAERGSGWYVTRAEIERRHPLRTSDLLRMTPGIQLVPAGGAGYAVRGRGGCAPAVYLDGVRLAGGAGSIDVWTHPEDLEGIEVYHGATVPVEYSGTGAGCGVVLLWTRVGE